MAALWPWGSQANLQSRLLWHSRTPLFPFYFHEVKSFPDSCNLKWEGSKMGAYTIISATGPPKRLRAWKASSQPVPSLYYLCFMILQLVNLGRKGLLMRFVVHPVPDRNTTRTASLGEIPALTRKWSVMWAREKIQMWPFSALFFSGKPRSPLQSTVLSSNVLKASQPLCLPAIIKSDSHIKTLCVCICACLCVCMPVRMETASNRSLSVVFLLTDWTELLTPTYRECSGPDRCLGRRVGISPFGPVVHGVFDYFNKKCLSVWVLQSKAISPPPSLHSLAQFMSFFCSAATFLAVPGQSRQHIVQFNGEKSISSLLEEAR